MCIIGMSDFISLEISDLWRERVFILLPVQKLQNLGYKTVLNFFFFSDWIQSKYKEQTEMYSICLVIDFEIFL